MCRVRGSLPPSPSLGSALAMGWLYATVSASTHASTVLCCEIRRIGVEKGVGAVIVADQRLEILIFKDHIRHAILQLFHEKQELLLLGIGHCFAVVVRICGAFEQLSGFLLGEYSVLANQTGAGGKFLLDCGSADIRPR